MTFQIQYNENAMINKNEQLKKSTLIDIGFLN